MLKRVLIILSFVFLTFRLFSQDIWKPDVPFLDSVSVDFSNLNGNVILGWEPSDSLDVMGYYIYKNTNTMASPNWTKIDSVLGRLTTTYTDFNADAEFHSEGYRIAAFDSSRNLSALSDYHYTMYAFPYSETVDCQFRIKLAWNTYIGWTNGVANYDIYREENSSGNMLYVGTVSSAQTYFIDTNVLDNSAYCYYIRANGHNGFTSSSNQTCRVVDIPNNPQFIVSLNASVEAENHITLKFLVDTGAQNVHDYRVFRSDSLNGTYSLIKTIAFSSSPELSFVDEVPSDKEKYYYKIAAFNNCGRQLLESNVVSNIVITAFNNGDLQHELYWEDFYQWLGGIQRFELHRVVEDVDEVIVNSTFSMNNYVDDISELPFKDHFYSGKFCYYIRYFEDNNNPFGYQDSSRSNMVCTQEFSRVFFPTAFSPLSANGNVNRIFKPSLLFISQDNYHFEIYNRWGEKIFETSNPSEGWDGKTKCGNCVAQSGKYVYLVTYTDANGDIHKHSGSFIIFQ